MQRLDNFRAILSLVLLLLAAPAWAATPLENLPYRVSLGPWEEVAIVNLSLQEMEPGRYLAEFSGAAKGMWSLLKRWLPERYRTEMICRNGRLQPLVYREELPISGRHVVKEYRFDYSQGRLEYWRQNEDQAFVKVWQVALKEPVYDVFSLFYNIRLGVFGPLASGETLRVQTIPNPDPVEMIINLGPESEPGRKVMLTVREKSGKEWGPYFINVGPQWVPRTAWIRVLKFGKLSGQLLDAGGIMKEGRLKLSEPRMSGKD